MQFTKQTSKQNLSTSAGERVEISGSIDFSDAKLLAERFKNVFLLEIPLIHRYGSASAVGVFCCLDSKQGCRPASGATEADMPLASTSYLVK